MKIEITIGELTDMIHNSVSEAIPHMLAGHNAIIADLDETVECLETINTSIIETNAELSDELNQLCTHFATLGVQMYDKRGKLRSPAIIANEIYEATVKSRVNHTYWAGRPIELHANLIFDRPTWNSIKWVGDYSIQMLHRFKDVPYDVTMYRVTNHTTGRMVIATVRDELPRR